MRVRRIAGLWIFLFAATLGVSALVVKATDHRPSRSGPGMRSSPDELAKGAESALTELKAKPRKSLGIVDESEGDAETEFGAALTEYINAHKDGLRACRAKIMARETRPSEYFEVSFVPQPATLSFKDSSGGRTLSDLVLSSVVLERSSLTLAPADEDCIVSEFKKMSFKSKQPPSYRTTYRFCFRALET